VAVGTVPGVYEHWADAKEQIKNVKGPKYKKFATKAEALEFVRSGGKSTAKPAVKGEKKGTGVATISGGVEESTSKRARTSTESAGPAVQRKLVRVYTDGSSRGNGKAGALAGVGVYFGDNDPRFVLPSPSSGNY
jgi:ribonuclease HI